MEEWIISQRYAIVETPKHWAWKSITDVHVTEDTKKMLSLFQDKFSDIAIFSWHPNIEMSQWKEFNPSHSYDKYSYNSRLTVDDSMIFLGNTVGKYSWDDTDIVLKQFPYIRTCAGNGRSQNRFNVLQRQISFLTSEIGTHEAAKIMKHTKITPGAYSFDGTQWKVILSSELDTTHLTRKFIDDYGDTVEKFISLFPELSYTRFKSKPNPENTFRIKLATDKRQWSNYSLDFTISKKLEPVSINSIFGTNNKRQYSEFIEIVVDMNKMWPDIVTNDILSLFSKDNYKEIIANLRYDNRGRLLSKDFGF